MPLPYNTPETEIREREFGINPQEQEIIPLSEHLKKINDFWREQGMKFEMK